MGKAVWRRRPMRWLVAALILALALATALWAISTARCFALVGEIICRVETDRPMIALTFDDGPTDRGVRDAKPGSILLMHVLYCANRTAREALPLVIRGLHARGFRIVPVSELLAAGGRDRLPAAADRR